MGMLFDGVGAGRAWCDGGVGKAWRCGEHGAGSGSVGAVRAAAQVGLGGGTSRVAGMVAHGEDGGAGDSGSGNVGAARMRNRIRSNMRGDLWWPPAD